MITAGIVGVGGCAAEEAAACAVKIAIWASWSKMRSASDFCWAWGKEVPHAMRMACPALVAFPIAPGDAGEKPPMEFFIDQLAMKLSYVA